MTKIRFGRLQSLHQKDSAKKEWRAHQPLRVHTLEREELRRVVTRLGSPELTGLMRCLMKSIVVKNEVLEFSAYTEMDGTPWFYLRLKGGQVIRYKSRIDKSLFKKLCKTCNSGD